MYTRIYVRRLHIRILIGSYVVYVRVGRAGLAGAGRQRGARGGAASRRSRLGGGGGGGGDVRGRRPKVIFRSTDFELSFSYIY